MSKILIIEDEAAMRKMIAQTLKYEGFDVFEAENGRVGVEKVPDVKPDLIVCDIMMPELDGFGVLNALRKKPEFRFLPFIFLTAKVEVQDIRHGMSQGADDYITKPFDPDALVESVKQRLDRYRLQQAEAARQRDEVSLTVAASIPSEMSGILDNIAAISNLLSIKYEKTDPQIGEIRHSLQENAERLRRMIKRLNLHAQLPQLYASRFEQEESAGTVVAGSPLIADTARALLGQWEREGDLKLELQDAAIPMKEDYLRLVVEELVDNAAKFSEKGTPVTIETSGAEAFFCLSVTNAGDPLPASQIEKIGAFKQFWTGKKKPEGLGLGLSLVQGVVRLYGGEVEISPIEGGTRVSVMVPPAN